MAVINITNDNFSSEVLNAKGTVLLDFWAPWCGPCRMVSPIIDEIAEEVTTVKVGKINIDEQPDLAAKYNVMSIPTIMVFNNGTVKESVVGSRSKEAIIKMLG